ncbi:hypothetical protein POVWA1_034290 [Plasmodium ovale wallikeri]|uniref:Uncharacterized protein n=1 Tax=Plasmodium ovale wallikeri TaxID=864142 RepID=A0A1A8YYI4_PLAOA|nr:hypothetical protein POVWA1_034290 [Plasmodium ovale wallikeri]
MEEPGRRENREWKISRDVLLMLSFEVRTGDRCKKRFVTKQKIIKPFTATQGGEVNFDYKIFTANVKQLRTITCTLEWVAIFYAYM